MASGFTLWLTGLSGAGKSTLAAATGLRLRAAGAKVEILDGDEVRLHLSRGLGFSKEDRDTNIRRIGWVAKTLSRHGIVAIVAAISPYRATRLEVREQVEAAGAGFVEVHVDCPLAVLVARDLKGLYAKALAGEIAHFTGVSDPYEPPEHPEVVVRSDRDTVEDGVERIAAAIRSRGLWPGEPRA